MPILSFQEVTTVFSQICRQINEIPYIKTGEKSLVSPATFIYPSTELSDISLAGTNHHMKDFSAVAVRMQKHLDTAAKIRADVFCNLKYYIHTDLKEKGQQKQGLSIKIGDVVLINPLGKYGQARFGVVTSMVSAQTVKVLTKERGQEIVAIINLFLVISNDLKMRLCEL